MSKLTLKEIRDEIQGRVDWQNKSVQENEELGFTYFKALVAFTPRTDEDWELYAEAKKWARAHFIDPLVVDGPLLGQARADRGWKWVNKWLQEIHNEKKGAIEVKE